MRVLNSIADLRALAKERVPCAIFEYADRGSYGEITISRNRSDLQAIQFRQRVMRDLPTLLVTSTTVPVTMPLGIAPTGLTRLFYGDGEIHGARAALSFGIPFTLSKPKIFGCTDITHADTRILRGSCAPEHPKSSHGSEAASSAHRASAITPVEMSS
jgi:L-lactate dehydrogenase (cytochrome)